MENYIVLASYKDPKEAYYLKFKLGMEGIEAFLLGSIDKTSSEPKNELLRLQVKTQDVERAVQVMIRVSKEIPGQPEEEKIIHAKKILVPIDFSENSSTACLFAFALAKNLGAEIKLLHVFNDPFIDSSYVSTRISYERFERSILYEIEEMARRNIVAFVQVLETELQKYGLGDIRFHYNLLKGKPENQIISVSETFNPYLIVLGSQGAGRTQSDIIGSVSTRVIEKTKVPVLVIPENWKFSRLEQLNILYATDFQETDIDKFDDLLKILKPFRVSIDCVHIEQGGSNPHKQMHLYKLESQFAEKHPETPVKCHIITHKDLLTGIQEFVDKANTHIISFTSPKRSTLYKIFYPNNLKKMVYQSKVPILVFHTSDTNE
jgi:nucleotide-binding universal stress UspA family protein